jgi:membrane fusion protein, heavy metal efflux system
MTEPNKRRIPWVRVALAIVVITGVLGVLALPPVQATIHGFFAAKVEGVDEAVHPNVDEIQFYESEGNQGLRLPAKAVAGLGINPTKAILATQGRPLPPQIGTLNYDNDRLFTIRARFPGELAEVRKVIDGDGPIVSTRMRPVRFGDRVKQGDLLAVIWSQQLGAAKAALVDAICALRLSEDTLKRYEELHRQGAMSLASLKAGERQVQADSNTLLTAERSLKMWKLEKEEIDEIKAEANVIHDQKKARSADNEMKWARVEVRVPFFDRENPDRELVVVEKNTNLGDMVDPINSPPLFKLADTSRLQIWVHPPEEYLPFIRDCLTKGPGLQWDIRVQSEARVTAAQKLGVVQIAPSLEPNQHTPMVLGYMPNPEGKHLVGQFVTATIFMPPDENTVEIPTDGLNEVEGQAYVFVQSDPTKREYALRRVAVVRRFKDFTFVRAVLTDHEKKISEAEMARGRRPMQPLLPNELVLTRGVVELTSALEELAEKSRIASKLAQ